MLQPNGTEELHSYDTMQVDKEAIIWEDFSAQRPGFGTEDSVAQLGRAGVCRPELQSKSSDRLVEERVLSTELDVQRFVHRDILEIKRENNKDKQLQIEKTLRFF